MDKLSRRRVLMLGAAAAVAVAAQPLIPAQAAIFAQMNHFNKTTGEMDVVTPTTGGAAWPAGDPLIFSPGKYALNGVSYDMTPEGFYSYFAMATSGLAYGDGEQHIVYSSDLDGLMKSMMHLFRFGNRDQTTLHGPNGMTIVSNLLKTQQASLLCGDTAAVTQHVLSTIPIPSRPVHVLRADTPNLVVDGHQPLEAYIGGRWQCYDVCLKRVWDDPINGGYLSLKDLVAVTGVANATAHEPIVPVFDSSPWNGKGYNTCQWWYDNGYTRAARDAAINGLYQIPGWDWPGGIVGGAFYPAGTYCYISPANVGRTAYVQGLGYKTLTDLSVITAMFYS